VPPFPQKSNDDASANCKLLHSGGNIFTNAIAMPKMQKTLSGSSKLFCFGVRQLPRLSIEVQADGPDGASCRVILNILIFSWCEKRVGRV
jgi:hypothetical protein